MSNFFKFQSNTYEMLFFPSSYEFVSQTPTKMSIMCWTPFRLPDTSFSNIQFCIFSWRTSTTIMPVAQVRIPARLSQLKVTVYKIPARLFHLKVTLYKIPARLFHLKVTLYKIPARLFHFRFALCRVSLSYWLYWINHSFELVTQYLKVLLLITVVPISAPVTVQLHCDAH